MWAAVYASKNEGGAIRLVIAATSQLRGIAAVWVGRRQAERESNLARLLWTTVGVGCLPHGKASRTISSRSMGSGMGFVGRNGWQHGRTTIASA